VKRICWIFIVLTAWFLGGVRDVAAVETPHQTPTKKLRVLVVAGGHGYPVQPFRDVFAGYTDMECTFVDEKQGGEAFENIADWPYDAIMLYNYMKKPTEKQRENFLGLLDRGVGLVILHHAIYGYRPWPEFQRIVGVTSWLSSAKDNVEFKVHIEDSRHPITQGVTDFVIRDEVYQGHGLDPKVHVLLTTDEPSNAKAVAWVHTYRKSPVCYFQLGHDTKAYAKPEFAVILGRSIRWTAGRLPGPDREHHRQ
jgi:type 1 glutamine amidotransferase